MEPQLDPGTESQIQAEIEKESQVSSGLGADVETAPPIIPEPTMGVGSANPAEFEGLIFDFDPNDIFGLPEQQPETPQQQLDTPEQQSDLSIQQTPDVTVPNTPNDSSQASQGEIQQRPVIRNVGNRNPPVRKSKRQSKTRKNKYICVGRNNDVDAKEVKMRGNWMNVDYNVFDPQTYWQKMQEHKADPKNVKPPKLPKLYYLSLVEETTKDAEGNPVVVQRVVRNDLKRDQKERCLGLAPPCQEGEDCPDELGNRRESTLQGKRRNPSAKYAAKAARGEIAEPPRIIGCVDGGDDSGDLSKWDISLLRSFKPKSIQGKLQPLPPPGQTLEVCDESTFQNFIEREEANADPAAPKMGITKVYTIEKSDMGHWSPKQMEISYLNSLIDILEFQSKTLSFEGKAKLIHCLINYRSQIDNSQFLDVFKDPDTKLLLSDSDQIRNQTQQFLNNQALIDDLSTECEKILGVEHRNDGVNLIKSANINAGVLGEQFGERYDLFSQIHRRQNFNLLPEMPPPGDRSLSEVEQPPVEDYFAASPELSPAVSSPPFIPNPVPESSQETPAPETPDQEPTPDPYPSLRGFFQGAGVRRRRFVPNPSPGTPVQEPSPGTPVPTEPAVNPTPQDVQEPVAQLLDLSGYVFPEEEGVMNVPI